MRYVRGNNAADSDDSRAIGRRHLLAAVATTGLGLATAGVQYGGGSPAAIRPATGTKGSDRNPTAIGQSTGGEALRTERGAGTGRAADERNAGRPALPGAAPIIGGNLNGRPHRLRNNFELIDASETTWIRAFLDVRKKNALGIDPETDPDVLALRHAARKKNCNLIVSLKWDFKANWGDKRPIPVPDSGSTDEAELCRSATRYLDGIGAPVDIVVLGNEPMWETLPEDIKVESSPIVRFTRTVKDYLVQHGDHGDPKYLVGSFNRTHSEYVRNQQFPQFHRELFEMVRDDADIDGIDLHIHYDAFAQAETALAAAREEVPEATITVTEFSPVWRYARHTDAPIGESEAGRRFARDYDLSADTTAVEYFEYAKANPRPPEEVADFYDAMPWYNANHVADMYRLFREHDVSVGTIGFLQDPGMRNVDWTTNWTPFHINFLFQPALMQSDGGIETTANPHYLDDYRERRDRGDSRST